LQIRDLSGRVNPSPQTIAAVEGWVKSESGEPVAGAEISFAGKVLAETGGDGYFSLSLESLGLSEDAGNAAVTLTASAKGYAPWTIRDATYRAGDTLRLYPRLTAGSATVLDAHRPGATRAWAYNIELLPSYARNDVPDMAAARFASLAPPPTIRVYRTATGVVEVVPFRQYVKHVLPHEWISSWSPESLKAGAMAVKTYAWYWVSRGGKQVALGADVKDNTEDQVYDTSLSYASTDAAVDATFNYMMTRNGELFQSQYCAGSYKADPVGDCPWPGPYMTQWGSAFHADQGRGWGWILQYYYGATITPSAPGPGYQGGGQFPNPTAVPPNQQPPPAPGQYVVGQGSNRPEVFQEAFTRNGGEAILGRPVGPVRWWMQYLSEVNVLSQRFSGARGQNDVWIIYNVLRSNHNPDEQAYVLAGEIGAAYASHQPPGPEWSGAPTSDPFISADGKHGQGFTNGLLQHDGQTVVLVPWPVEFEGWKAEYFAGHKRPQSPAADFAAKPAFVTNLASPNLAWSASDGKAQSVGAGKGEWAAQMTRRLSFDGNPYEITLKANGPALLWIDGAVVVNGLEWSGQNSTVWSGQLSQGMHTVRVQYYAAGSDALLELGIAHPGAAPPAPTPLPGILPPGSGASLRVSVRWLGGELAPHANWSRPLTLHLSDVQTSARLLTVEGRTNEGGVALFEQLPPGTYHVHVKGPHSLQSALPNIELKDGQEASLDMKAQIEGDVDGDNCVTVDDFALVQAMLGAHAGIPGFDPSADLDADGIVTMNDISLLRSGFDMCGDVPADGGFSAMSVPGNVPMSEYLSPWTNPERLRRDLAMKLVASNSTTRVGNIVEVRVVAQAGSQPVDGASFVLRYDPNRLALVDAVGNEADGAEPGLALPAVMGNWIDRAGGALGYSAGTLQGNAPQGDFTVATLRFRALPSGTGPVQMSLESAQSGLVQLTYGGRNLLANVGNLDLNIAP
jgi:hypothetical protein